MKDEKEALRDEIYVSCDETCVDDVQCGDEKANDNKINVHGLELFLRTSFNPHTIELCDDE